MISEGQVLDIELEVDAMAEDIRQGLPHASVHLARLIEADERGVFRPYAQAVGARLRDYVARGCELCRKGARLDDIDFQDEAYGLMRLGAIDWDEIPCAGRPGEEA